MKLRIFSGSKSGIIFFSCVFLFQTLYSGSISAEKDGSVKVSDLQGNTARSANLINICDGRDGDKDVPLLFQKSSGAENGDLQLYYKEKSGTLEIKEEFSRNQSNILFCKVRIKNIGPKQAWLKVSAGLPLSCKDVKINYWDGVSLKENFFGKSSCNILPGAFPATAVFNTGNGLAIGIAADQIFSFIERSLVYEDEKKLSFGVKMVIDPEKEESVVFVIYDFNPEYGFLNAIDVYYKLFPKAFNPADGVDLDAVYSADATSIRSIERTGSPAAYEEFTRRMFGEITWWYAPYKKDGEFWSEDDAEWERPLRKDDKLERMYRVTRTEYLENLKKQLKRAELKHIKPMYYILGWCETELAERKYRKEILRFPDGSPLSVAGWVLPWSDTYCMWWNGKFAEDTRKALSTIVNECDIYGFSMDCAEGNKNLKVRAHNGLDGVPGRAYDENGIYCDDGVGITRMMDYVHTLKKGDRRMCVYPNFSYPAPYFTCFRTDTSLCEPDFQRVMREMDTHLRIRYLLGAKPRQLLSTDYAREVLGKSVDWRNMPPEKIKNLYKNVYDTAFLMCFRLGYYPSQTMQSGYPEINKNMPVLTAALREGWEPVPAIRLDSELWTARYGNGLRSRLFTGNQKSDTKNVKAVIDNKYLGKGVYLFVPFEGGRLENTVSGGRTELSFSLPGKKYMLLKALLQVECENDFTASVEDAGDISGGTISAKINRAKVGEAAIFTVEAPSGGIITAVNVDGKPVNFEKDGSRAVFKAESGEENTVVIHWKSTEFLSPADMIKNFPFVSNDGKALCSIVIREDADEWDIAAANALKEYFRFYFAQKNDKNHDGTYWFFHDKVKNDVPVIPVKKVSESASISGNQVRIGIGTIPENGTVKVSDNSVMSINGPNSNTRYAMTFKLMRLLDEKYPYYGRIVKLPKDEDSKQMRLKAGLGIGNTLE